MADKRIINNGSLKPLCFPAMVCLLIVYRPGEDGDVQTPLLLIHSLSTDPLWKYIQNTVSPKPEELGH